jgi:hypothetical protein
MRWVVSQRTPTGARILLIESGSRSIIEGVIAHLHSGWGEGMPIDLVTCYAGLPAGLEAAARVFRVADFSTPERRRDLVRELRGRDYAYAGMICAAEPIMSKWKWWLAAKMPAKFFVINENGDYFWLNRKNAKAMLTFILFRLGLSGAGASRTLGRLLVFPFSVLYLLLYAGVAHLRRFIRLKIIQT